jgi:hypothetical protein
VGYLGVKSDFFSSLELRLWDMIIALGKKNKKNIDF